MYISMSTEDETTTSFEADVPLAAWSRRRQIGGTRRARKLNAKGETRLHVAARLNKTHDVVMLVMEGADVNARDFAGLRHPPPLCRRHHRNHQETFVKRLLQHKTLANVTQHST